MNAAHINLRGHPEFRLPRFLDYLNLRQYQQLKYRLLATVYRSGLICRLPLKATKLVYWRNSKLLGPMPTGKDGVMSG